MPAHPWASEFFVSTQQNYFEKDIISPQVELLWRTLFSYSSCP